MSGREDIDTLAAEFVLGTLDASERASVAARRPREPALDAAIEAWNQRLSPLTLLVPDVAPPALVWTAIESRLDGGEAFSLDTNIVDLRRRLTRWRRIALGAAALAASVLIVAGSRELTRDPAPRTYVAVFQKDDALPAFLMTIDLDARQLSIRPVAARTPPGKIHQLWIATETSGGKPKSLGLVENPLTMTRVALSAFEPGIVRTALFGVSLEPAGGSPTGQPTGPVFHARLLEASP